MKRSTITIAVLAVVLALGSPALTASPAPRLVNYQGVLTDFTTGVPLQGLHDLTFTVYGDSLGIDALWSETQTAVQLTDGLFNVLLGGTTAGGVPLDLFSGRDRFLGVAVDAGGEVAPRMRIASVPWALRAAVADSLAGGGSGAGDGHSLDAADGDPVDALSVDDEGRVGIGTSNPHRALEICGQNSENGLRVWYGSSYSTLWGEILHGGSGGLIINSNAGGGSWADITLQTNGNTRMHLNSAGNLGIGTTSPAARLDVAGTVRTEGFAMPTGAVSGYVLTSDSGGSASWQPGGGASGDGDWTVSGSNMYSSVSGNVGVGTASPECKLEILSGSTNAEMCDFDDNMLQQSWTAVTGTYGSDAAGYVGRRAVNLGTEFRYGLYGSASGVDKAYGCYGSNGTSLNSGYLAGSDYGAYGYHGETFNYGALGTEDHGVYGLNMVSGSGENPGVYGANEPTGNYAYLGGDALAAYARHGGTLNNVQMGASSYALRAQAFTGDAGLFYGNVKVMGGRLSADEIEITGGADLSEQFEIGGADGNLPEPGQVVSIDPDHPGRLAVSREAYDRKVAGVISGAGGIDPGLLMGQTGSVADGDRPVALSGRVYCWADAADAPIVPGDFLTTSDRPGHAMKATDHERARGAIIGKAMTPLADGRGLVLVLVRPQ